ncbi:hypothetical protein [Streptomyces sp. NPDC003077]|uniref:hypothetical protein n=1 Tax=Streptomyces sp. NPDC003077 TaxID=3154443 RepID=UPI0033B8CD89
MPADPGPQYSHAPSPFVRAARWIAAVSGLLTSAALLLLVLTGHLVAVAPVALFGAALTGGTAVTVTVHLRA